MLTFLTNNPTMCTKNATLQGSYKKRRDISVVHRLRGGFRVPSIGKPTAPNEQSPPVPTFAAPSMESFVTDRSVHEAEIWWSVRTAIKNHSTSSKVQDILTGMGHLRNSGFFFLPPWKIKKNLSPAS